MDSPTLTRPPAGNRQERHRLLDKLSHNIPGVIYQYLLRADGTTCFPYASDGIRDIYELAPEDVLNDSSPVTQRLHPEDREHLGQTIRTSAASLSIWDETYRVLLPGKGLRWMAGRAQPERLEDGSVLWHGFITDITDRKLAEQREAHRNRVLQMLTEQAPLQEVLTAIARDVESANPASLCSILLLDATHGQLHSGAAPSLPDFYNEALDGLAIGPGVGSCGTAAHTGKRTIVEDISTHPWWAPFRELTQRAGLGSCWSQPILAADGKVLGTFAIYHRDSRAPSAADLRLIDDEARIAALAIERTAAAASLRLAASVFSHAREGILITDAAGCIVEVNETFTRITGYSRQEALGRHTRMLHSDHHPPEFHQAIQEALSDKDHWYGEIWSQRKNGEVYPQMVTISTVRNGAGAVVNLVSLFTDITLMKQHQHQLEHIAHYDLLTGLPNRVLLADRLQLAIVQSQRRERKIGVVFLDLDGFKAVNDTHGHMTGDNLLITLAARLKATLREGDTLARIGGDEFVAVIVDLEQASDCEPLLERMLQAAAAPVLVGDKLLQVTASMGVTLYPQDGTEPELLVRQADQAMYLAKQAGKNRYHLFDVVRDAAVKSQRESLEHIRQALQRSEFRLHYQPKVNMRTGRVIGAEALIRWQHPTRGLLAPSVFLPTIEDHPMSVELGEWVIDAALAQMGDWRSLGLDLPVSINLGARQLQLPDFPARLAALLAAHPEVPPAWLELEVLETSALEDMAQVHKVMHACHDLGVAFALDDFGTGYSSLTYLKHLPADTLKIDRSFVLGMLGDPNDLAIVEGIIGLANAFRRAVIAEGVETAAHGARLLALGCERAQGYGIARPMPPDAFPPWMAQWVPDPSWHG